MRVFHEDGWIGTDAVPPARQMIASMQRTLDEFKRNGGARARRPNTSEFDAAGRWKFAGVLAEMKASNEGRELGERYAGDPHRAARALNIPIERHSAQAIAALAGRSVYGRWVPGRGVIQISDRLSRRDEAETIAHEIAHSQGHGIDDDKIADVFARAFMREAPRHPMFERAAAAAAWEARLRAAAR